MTLRKLKRKNISVFSIIFIILVSSLFIFSISHNQYVNSSINNKIEGSEFNRLKNPQLGAQETLTAVWLENPDFEDDPIEPTWYSEVEGDPSDVKATTSPGQVNFEIIGETHKKQVILNDTTYTNWEAFNKSEFALVPQRGDIAGPYYGIDSDGAWCTHRWWEFESGGQPKNTPEMHWRTNVSLPVDMSDYNITSVDFNAIINGIVDTYVDTPGDTLAREGFSINQYEKYDYAQFYVEVSTLDVDELKTYRIAFNQTLNLGNEDLSLYTIEGLIGAFDEQAIINALNNVLAADPGHDNFTVIIGIYIYCEDNQSGYDLDDWTKLRFITLNLTFSYEKKIDQFTSASWNQDGEQISDISNDTVVINEAKLNFKYKIDYNWTESSPNSEIQAFINNNKLSETIKLRNIEANNSFQLAKKEGYDVTDLIPYNTKINFSIQVYLADEFSLDKKITFSIDDVYLNITYTVIFPDYQTNLQVFFNGVNKTANPIYEHAVGHDLNITVKYPDDVGAHISGAVVQLSGNLTRTFIENEAYGQYTIIINANDLNVGTFHLKIVAHKINYKLSVINPIVTVKPYISEDLQLFINGENRTSNPSFEISLDKLLNLTIKYNTTLGNPVTGATVTLSGEGILRNLNESVTFNQYSVIINTTLHLKEGVNPLTIEAKKLNYETAFTYPRITVRKINSEITPVNTNTIDTQPGGNATIQVYINNTDFDEIIKGVLVSYSWEFGEGILEDLDNDGIYELNITNIPAGTHSIIINAFGSDKYNFVSLEVIIVATKPGDASFLFRILLIVGIIVSIGLGSYLYVYQKVLKFPRAVRKVRKYNRTLRRAKTPKIAILNRKKAFNSVYQEELNKASKFLKIKPTKVTETPEKTIKKASENSEVNLPSEPSNQNTNSYNIDKNKKSKFKKYKSLKVRFILRLRRKWSGSFKISNSKKILYLIIILSTLTMYSLIFNPFFNQSSINFSDNSSNFIQNDNINNLRISAQESDTKQWLNNSNLTSPLNDTWYPSYGEFGDNSDVLAINSSDYVNYTIIGETYEKQVILNDTTYTNWEAFNKSEFALVPQRGDIPGPYYGIDSDGAWCTHRWWEDESGGQPKNTPEMHWRTNVSLPVDMSDYIITSVDFNAIINGTVDTYIDTPNDTDARSGVSLNQYEKYDYAQFYVEVSTLDVDELKTYRIAFNQTLNLGNEDLSLYTIEGLIGAFDEQAIIDALNNVLAADPGHDNFTVIIGIYIYCEDNNNAYDLDIWTKLRFKTLNLTFIYVKKIDQFTSASWNQDADKISDLSSDTVVVDKALLNFNYKIDQNWTESSPNSEFRILINGNEHPETVELSKANTTFQKANIMGGFDVTPLIIDDVNLSIQVFLADEFGLDHNITISIDDVTLNITYTIITDDKVPDLYLFLNDVNKTNDPNINIYIGDSLNITVKYLDNITSSHIPSATVQLLGNFTGKLEENASLEQYTTIINTDASDAGTNFLTITAQAEDYETKQITVRVNIIKFGSNNLQIILNNQDVTPDPYIKLTIGEILNISVKYKNIGGTHISGANLLLTSETFTSYLNESVSLMYYSIIINTSERLEIGDNYLTLEAQSETFQTQTAAITVSISKINLDIVPTSGSNTIEIRTGRDIRLQIYLYNPDLGELVEGAIVTYSWEQGVGILTDADNDGIYEATIENIPEGTFSIEISAFIGDDYYAEDYEIIVAASSEVEEENILFPILFTASIILITSLAIYLYAYQTYLKYPRQVRKVRKYRKSLKRESVPSVHIIGREAAFKSLYNKNLSKLFRLKRHPTKGLEQKPTPDKLKAEDISQKLESEDLIDKSLEKKEELDKIVDKSLDENAKPT